MNLSNPFGPNPFDDPSELPPNHVNNPQDKNDTKPPMPVSNNMSNAHRHTKTASSAFGGGGEDAPLSNNSLHGASTGGGISRWFNAKKDQLHDNSSSHGSGAIGDNGINIANAVQKRLGDRTSTGVNSSTIPTNNTFNNNSSNNNNGTHKKHHRNKNRNRNRIHKWPYDNYHKIQQRHYTRLDSTNSLMSGMSDADSVFSGNRNHNKHSNMTEHLYERPPDLPSIPEAVRNLNLMEFENVAQERAINIVSTMLFDTGLIDELLVHGGMGLHRLMNNNQQNGSPRSATSANNASSRQANDDASVKTSEGVEVGAHGFPVIVDGGLKFDKEMNKLRSNTQKHLNVINTRLNDGVATSGAEVQELVNAVHATKGDLGKLRELSTFIVQESNKDMLRQSGRGDNQEKFILSNYPRLKTSMNARKNLLRCFRELEFFAQIPATCERLRDEMHSGEWSSDEWSTVRSVCMEHVELQQMLLEADTGIKARLTGDGAPLGQVTRRNSQSGAGGARGFSTKYDSQQDLAPGSYEAVDRFLSGHIKNVWELGEEIRRRILAGIGEAYDLALNNPTGMVALCEAVEVYERAEQQFRLQHPGVDLDDTFHFTAIRESALSQIYRDFERRGFDVFHKFHQQSGEQPQDGGGEPGGYQFSAILRGATELVADMGVVKNQISPCFPDFWCIDVLWTSCVAHVCSNHILTQIGGPDGQELKNLTVTQLLDLVAWIEYFREHVEESFPKVAQKKTTEKTYFDTRPDLFQGNKKEVNMDNATDSLAWANNMLWEVHRLAQDEFLLRTREQTDQLLGNVYKAQPEENQTNDGKLQSSLCEDVFSLVGVQLRTISEHLSPTSDALVHAICIVFSHLRSQQIHNRDNFLNDLESCCASANDFSRMSEKCEEVLSEIISQSELADENVITLQNSSSELLALYSSDAVYAAQCTHEYIFQPIYDEIADQFFTEEWEQNMTSNELSQMVIKTIEDFMIDLERFLDELLLKKTIEALVTACVSFYVKALCMRAEQHKGKQAAFSDIKVALERYKGDVGIMRSYFDSHVQRSRPLARIIEKEFAILTTIHEIMAIAAELTEGDPSDFILVVHKKIKNFEVTKHFIADLYHLVNPAQERAVSDIVAGMEDDLNALTQMAIANNTPDKERMVVPNLQLGAVLEKLYDESKRKLPTGKQNWILG